MNRFVWLALLVSAPAAWSAESFRPLIYQGNWMSGSSFSFQKESSELGGTTTTETDINTQYFVADQFAIGPSFYLLTSSGSEAVGLLGPSLTYYVSHWDQWAVALNGSFELGLTNATVDSVLRARVRLEYFFNPSVSIGPQVFYNLVNRKFGSDGHRYGLALGFGLHF